QRLRTTGESTVNHTDMMVTSRLVQQSGAKLRAKVLAPAATETSFADRARDTEGFDYSENVAKYHTAREMAEFLWELLEGDEVVGIVDPEDYSFSLRGPIKPYAG
ncbi:MAG: hypothetical protein IKE23_12920, partial [Exiguobacterium sp.]|nr:hypothetical protein [Exiguobacterium sp.]